MRLGQTLLKELNIRSLVGHVPRPAPPPITIESDRGKRVHPASWLALPPTRRRRSRPLPTLAASVRLRLRLHPVHTYILAVAGRLPLSTPPLAHAALEDWTRRAGSNRKRRARSWRLAGLARAGGDLVFEKGERTRASGRVAVRGGSGTPPPNRSQKPIRALLPFLGLI